MKIKKIILTVASISWMALIFFFSNQESTASTNISNSFMDSTIIKIYKIFDNDVTIEESKLIREYFFLPVRKLAHLAVYFILGILVIFTLKEYNVEKNIICYAILFCALYAISDEIHQLFVIGRSGEVKDVLLDSFGSSLAIVIFKNKVKVQTK